MAAWHARCNECIGEYLDRRIVMKDQAEVDKNWKALT